MELTNKSKVTFQQLPVGVEPSMSQAVVFVFPNDVVHDVSQETCHHQDLHVVTLPAVLKVSRDLCKGTETVI